MPLLLALGFVAVANPPVVQQQVVALVIGNNAGGEALPTLAYADDDAVRMAALLQQTGATVELLTRLDDETARIADVVPVAAPTRAAFDAAVHRLAQVVATATVPTTFVLYFAGHGDAEQGAGALMLEDSRLRYHDLRSTIDLVKANTTHVLLDACNAFFVVHARGPSGRAWATPSTAGAALSSTLSDVGVFVSTSAEAQVFEWSQLSGGIFSHALRSGLRGAADADVDGVITYAELEAFIRVATEGLVNAAYVPQLFARAPQHSTTLLNLQATNRRPLAATAGRVTVRDDRGVILLDVHPEPSFVPHVLLPTGPLMVERVDDNGQWSEQLLDAANEQVSAVRARARGPAGLLQRLFALPFGPFALRAFVVRPKPPEVFGVSLAQQQRLRLYLQTLRDDAAQTREAARFGTTAMFVAAAVGSFGAAGASLLQSSMAAPVGYGVVGAALLGVGAVSATGLLHRPSDTERAADELLRTPPQASDSVGVQAARVANTIDAITAAADKQTLALNLLVAAGLATGAVSLGLASVALGCPTCVGTAGPKEVQTVGGILLLAGALTTSVATMAAVLPSDAARLEALMQQDPESVVRP